MTNRNQLFIASCFALVTTSLAFSLRAGILGQLGKDFKLDAVQLGFVNSMAFLGFPIATIVGGFLYNAFGPKKIMWSAFAAHFLGIILTITSGSYFGLLISTLFIGFGNGMVEAACNPMIATLYPDNKTKMLNKFHVWFPGGIVIGSLVSLFMTNLDISWQWQVGFMFLPLAIYGILLLKSEFPALQTNGLAATSENFSAMATPLFIFMAICMTLTATTELGTGQWIEKLLASSAVPPLLVLAMVSGVMALGRFFAGPIVHRLNASGVLWGSAFFSLAGIYLMSQATTANTTIIAALLFAVGVCYFWPTMLGFVAENLPKTGALGMSVLGGAGMFATSIWQPVIGGWLKTENEKALAAGFTAEKAELVAGQATLGYIAYFPAVLLVLFGGLYFYMRHRASTVLNEVTSQKL